jgi:hypothetical protein
VADLMRVMAVSLYGGVYADTDTMPLQPLDSWVGDRPGWVGASPHSREHHVLSNATFGFPPGAPFLADVWRYAADALARGVTNEHFVAGPHAFREVWERDRSLAEVSWDFEGAWDPWLKRMVLSGDFDLERVRAAFPDAPVLHTGGGGMPK